METFKINYEDIASLPRQDKEQVYKIWELTEISRCQKNPWYFITNYCKTLDEHDLENPFKLFPKKEYLKVMVDVWQKENLLIVPKSRQMMATWLFTTLNVWTALKPGRKCLFLSKKEADADAIKERAVVILEGLPSFLKPNYSSSYCRINLPDIKSEIKAMSSEPNAVRMYTASSVLADEFAFMEKPRDVLTALKPCVTGGGKITILSTPNGRNFFYNLVHDKNE